MNKQDWIWVSIRVFGLYLLIRAVISIATLIQSSALLLFLIERSETSDQREMDMFIDTIGRIAIPHFASSLGGLIIYSLLGSCKAMDIDIETYLRETFEALPHMTNQTAPDWTPAAWIARQNADSARESDQ